VDSQFKQRLTGAVILVLLAVVLVPELLTGPKSHPSGPTSSVVPSGDAAPLRSYDIDLSDAPQGVVPAEPPSPAADESAPAPAGSSPQAIVRPAQPAPAPPQKAAPAALPAVPVAAPSRQPDTAALRAAGSDAPDAKPSPQPPLRGFAVQVGSFASKTSAERLAADLGRRRFSAFVSPVRTAGRQLFRVRVGPVGDRAAAQALANRLKAAGQTGSVVPLP
jgi:DedD protein